jgi:diguanylate cyclase (GGDEF)-like protein
MAAVHPVLPPDGRALNYLLSSAATVPAVAVVLTRTPAGRRAPWWLLMAAMAVVMSGNAVVAFGGPGDRLTAELLDTVGHTGMLAAAVALVLKRGRNDVGGILDLSVAAVAGGGLLWTSLLSPRLLELHTRVGDQLTMLISVLVLGGVLGALMRLWFLDRRQPSLRLLVCALLAALAGNVAMAWTQGTMTGGRGTGVELVFMLAYACVGLSVLHPAAPELVEPGEAPVDRLSNARLAFLGAALVSGPLAGGARAMVSGLGADGPLLAAGSVLITSLVMIRVGRLAQQRHEAEQLLRHRATHDQLTGLPNRAELLTRLDAALERERTAGRPAVVLLFCDLNGFKQVNDRLGHEAGDLLLTGVAGRIRAGLREGDTLARYGGDEFLLLCEDGAQEAAVLRLTAYVEEVLASPFLLAGEAVTIGASVGAVISDGGGRADDLISRADQAMYRAKQGPRHDVRSARR